MFFKGKEGFKNLDEAFKPVPDYLRTVLETTNGNESAHIQLRIRKSFCNCND